MDFGDILDEWDKAQKEEKKRERSHPKSPKLKQEDLSSYDRIMRSDNEKKANPMTVWLNRYGTIDKDKIADSAEEESRLHDREYIRTMRPEATIDLHGLTRDEAWNRLNSFVGDCVNRGLRKILIVHGKGLHSHSSDPVLGPMVRLFIEKDSRLGTSGHQDRNHGGSGATWVLIKGNVQL